MQRRTFLGAIAAAGFATARGGRALSQAPVALGGDVLLRDHRDELRGRGIGIITNQTGVTSNGTSIVDAALHGGLRVHALFAPEHGLRGDRQAGAFVQSYEDAVTGLPVYSLYGPDKHPSEAMLSGIDVLLFDIQDVGARTYTFISTMAYAMQSAAAHGIEFWVLDRPNPVGGTAVEGPVLDPRFSSFIGLYPIAMRHGMTIGELARLFNQHFGIGAKLRVIPMEGWTRSMLWPQTGLRWIRTSPNIPTWKTTFVYLCTGLIDSAGLNNGVGTQEPFFFAGARDLDARTFASRLNATGTPGIVFDAADWSPDRGANAGISFSGARLRLSEPARFTPVLASVEIAVAARDLRRDAIAIRSVREIDIDWGTDAFRTRLLAGERASEIVASWQPELDAFVTLRQRFLLYT